METLVKKEMQHKMSFIRRLLYKFAGFMQGRYGIDGLYIPILIVSCVFTLLGSIFHSLILRFIGSLFLLLLVFRALSKKHSARQKELYAYYKIKDAISSWFRKTSARREQRAFKRYFKCPKCKAKLSVPKGKGKIKISCRKCGHQFIKKT